jgi:hypothetical protein
MKKALILLFAVVISGAALYSQQEQSVDVTELLRSDLRTQKLAVVTVNMALTDAQGELFWPIYRKYEAELVTLNDQVVALIKDYAQNLDKITDAKADAMTKQVFAIHGARLKLQEKYYNEFAKALGAALAAKYMQIERQLTAAVDLQIASQIPLIKKAS